MLPLYIKAFDAFYQHVLSYKPYFASSQHAIGVPDAYIMAAGGWESDMVLKNIYRNELTDVKEKMSKKAVNHYSKLIP